MKYANEVITKSYFATPQAREYLKKTYHLSTVAKKVGITREYFSKWLRGDHGLKEENYKKLMDVIK